jgi:hypothetical protein
MLRVAQCGRFIAAACVETPARRPRSALAAARCARSEMACFGPHLLSGSPTCVIRGWPDTNDAQRRPFRQFEARTLHSGEAKSNSHLSRAQFVPNRARNCGHSWLVHGQPFSLHVRQSPSQSFKGFVFQAGHASSILVTRSTSSRLVNSPFQRAQIFEHSGDNNEQAGHAHSMIIGARVPKCLVNLEFTGRESELITADPCPIRAQIHTSVDAKSAYG